MSPSPRRGARPLAEIVSDLMTPVCRKRGVANAALILNPIDLFGERLARSADVERIMWPKGARIDNDASTGATLVVSADAAAALTLQHVAPQIVERANLMIGWPAIARLKVNQRRRRPRKAPPAAALAPLDAAVIARHEAALPQFTHKNVKSALARLAAGIERRGFPKGGNNP